MDAVVHPLRFRTDLARKATLVDPGLSLSVLAFVYLTASCAHDAAKDPFPAPPKGLYRPGQSLSSSRLCSCRACRTSECCAGEQEGFAQCEDDVAVNEAGHLDFSAGEGCGMDVSSCAGQCDKLVWRAPKETPCRRYAPPQCCAK